MTVSWATSFKIKLLLTCPNYLYLYDLTKLVHNKVVGGRGEREREVELIDSENP